jgi:hypothetical protein
LNEARPEHQQLVRNTRAAVIALSAALDAERDFMQELSRSRVSVASLPAVPYRIRQAVGSRQSFASGVNESDRIISAYLGENWDHSQVVR